MSFCRMYSTVNLSAFAGVWLWRVAVCVGCAGWAAWTGDCASSARLMPAVASSTEKNATCMIFMRFSLLLEICPIIIGALMATIRNVHYLLWALLAGAAVLVAGCARLPSSDRTQIKAATLTELERQVAREPPRLELFLLQGPFDVV